jgi:hypothetical protein
MDNHINWMNYMKQMIPKISEACYTIRLMVHSVTLTLWNQFIIIYHKILDNFLG